jgi:hypothetical protein
MAQKLALHPDDFEPMWESIRPWILHEIELRRERPTIGRNYAMFEVSNAGEDDVGPVWHFKLSIDDFQVDADGRVKLDRATATFKFEPPGSNSTVFYGQIAFRPLLAVEAKTRWPIHSFARDPIEVNQLSCPHIIEELMAIVTNKTELIKVRLSNFPAVVPPPPIVYAKPGVVKPVPWYRRLLGRK